MQGPGITAAAPAIKATWSADLTLEEKILAGIALYFLAMRLLLAFSTFPTSDESYYWLWGQHLALSYFDHPPLEAWIQRLSYELFGRSYFALRLPALAALIGTLLIFYKVARRIAGEQWRLIFLRSTVVYLGTVLLGLFCALAYIDYLLAVLMMGAGYCFIVFFSDTEEKGRGSTAHLFAGAVLLGLCGLTKYNAIFLGVAVAALVVTRPRLRRLLSDWRLYAAALVALAMQTPIVIFSLQTDFASFQFHLVARHPDSIEYLDVGEMKNFILYSLVVMSPFIVPAIVSFFWAQQPIAFERLGKVLAIWTFWLSSLAFLYVASVGGALWWWNLAAFPLLMPFLGRYIGRGMLILHVVYGLLLNTLVVTSFAVAPLTWVVFGINPGMDVETTIGWDRIGAVVKEAEQREQVDFLSADSYQLASQLAFALNDPDVMAIADRRKAFDDWTDVEARRGQRGLVLSSGATLKSDWKARFQSFRKVADILAERPGFPSRQYMLYLGEGYIPPPSPGSGR